MVKRHYSNTPTLHYSNAALRRARAIHKATDHFGIKLTFRHLDPRMERFRRVIRQDRNLPLRNDRAVIDLFINKMHRAAGDPFSCGQRL